MKCNQFEIDLADWVRQRLPEDASLKMERHASECASCASEAALERRMAAAWQAMPDAPPAPELWPKVAARMERPERRPWFAWNLGRLAVGGSLAAGAVCAAFFMHFMGTPNSENNTNIATGVDEHKVVTMVAQMRELPESDPDALAPDTHMRRDLMLGRIDRP